jgi:membrane-associated protease RseP (regulator of RpoE activity)
MIIISILIHILGNYLPKWILPKIKQQNPIVKLSGLLIDFFTAFLILLLISLTSTNTYTDNKNAVCGLEFNDTMQKLGFQNGDKIISINNQPVKDINKIGIDIIMNPNSIIKIRRKNDYKEISINDNDITKILQSKGTLIKAKNRLNTEGDKIQEIKQTKEKFSFRNILKIYQKNIRGAYDFINPKKDYKKLGGIRPVGKGFREKILFLAFCCTIVGLLNLLPLPGFSLGNFIISAIELKRGKTFNLKKKNIVCLCTVFIVILIVVFFRN